MTKQTEAGQERKFVCVVVPWLVAAAALLLYLLTLNHWISIGSLPFAARVMGLNWMPELTAGGGTLGPYGPPLFLVTYPFRWLPGKWVPLALNLFSAVCAALTLAMLARSVALLPHDRTHEQRQREHGSFSLLSLRTAWIPPVLAAALGGLQSWFWQSATAASGDIFDLMLFAYVIRCLLEFRIARRDSWLLRAALVYAVAMTGSWLMVALVPFFLASVLWVRGVSFFNLRFLGGMLLCGLAGTTLYLLLPLVFVLKGSVELSFWDALKTNLLAQKAGVSMLFRLPNYLLLLLATTSFLPILLVSIRWASYFGDPSKVGIAVTTAILHVAHAALLAVCVWVAFDPVFSPIRIGLVLPQLDYLRLLSVGYFIGYFLLVFRPLAARTVRIPAWQTLLNRLTLAAIWALLLLAPLGLICKNVSHIRMTNGPAMGQYASLLTGSLPGRAVLLCDSENVRGDLPQKLWLAQAWLARTGKVGDYIFLDTLALQFPAYHGLQQKRYPGAWPALTIPKNVKRVPDQISLNLLYKLSQQQPLYYLHPSFGYYFEVFYPQSHGLTLELKLYSSNSIAPPSPTAAEIAENENFWNKNQDKLELLRPWIKGSATNQASEFGQRLKQRLKIPPDPNVSALTLGRYYSQARNFWGVQMQIAGRLREAGRHFEAALQLNPDNPTARANFECNTNLQAGRPLKVPPTPILIQEFAKFRDWQQILRDNGLFDDPTHCFVQANVFAQGRLVRQAALQFDRVHDCDPANPLARFWLARFYATHLPEKTLALISQMRADPEPFEEIGIHTQDFSTLEAVALFSSHKTNEAERVLQQAMDERPTDEALLRTVVQISGSFGRLTNALSAVERELRINPTNTVAMIIQGYLHMQLGNFAQAAPAFTRVLSLESNNYTARFDRAISYLRNDQLDQAQRDYELLSHAFPTSFRIDYGLAEIAWRRRDTNAAIFYCERYLTNSPPDTEEARQVQQRLQSLRPAPQ